MECCNAIGFINVTGFIIEDIVGGAEVGGKVGVELAGCNPKGVAKYVEVTCAGAGATANGVVTGCAIVFN
jgi:hypothetical protein